MRITTRPMRRYLATIALAFSLTIAGLQLAAPVAWAQSGGVNDGGLSRTCEKATGADCTTAPPLSKTLGIIVSSFLVLLGFIFLMLIVWGGIHWMTAGGNEEKVSKAKMMINAAIGGLVVVFISYALADAIVDALSAASGTGP